MIFGGIGVSPVLQGLVLKSALTWSISWYLMSQVLG
jgi:hypothetical protein